MCPSCDASKEDASTAQTVSREECGSGGCTFTDQTLALAKDPQEVTLEYFSMFVLPKVVTGALPAVTSATLVVTSATLVVTSATLVVTNKGKYRTCPGQL